METVSSKQATMHWVDALDPSLCYELREELRSGEYITHRATATRDEFTHEELKVYVYNIWLDSHPPELVICPIPAP